MDIISIWISPIGGIVAFIAWMGLTFLGTHDIVFAEKTSGKMLGFVFVSEGAAIFMTWVWFMIDFGR